MRWLAAVAVALGLLSGAPATLASGGADGEPDAEAVLITSPLIGGGPAAAGELPWMTYLLVAGPFGYTQCGGSLIAPQWVLTAAHCVDGAVGISALIGRTTAPADSDDPDLVDAVNWYIEDGYEASEFGVNDLALVQLGTPSSAPTLHLATPADAGLMVEGTPAKVAGWGITGDGAPASDLLLVGDTRLRSDAECAASYSEFDPVTNTCAGFTQAEASEPVGSCRGDSGGPLVVASGDERGWVQVGIVSYGIGECTSLQHPGVYMRVSAFFDSIEALVGELPGPSQRNQPDPPSDLQVERWAGDDRYETSVRISQESLPGGADVVFLATGDSFPDALAAGPAAATLGGPVLLTRTDELPAVVAAEIARLGPGTVYVLGGDAVVSDEVADQVTALVGTPPVRLAGADRYETAATVSEFAFAAADTVFVAVGTSSPDALTAGAPGGWLGRPLLLTRAQTVPAATLAEIGRLGEPDVIVLGGTAAVSDAVLAELQTATAGLVRRVSGADRYVTAVTVSVDSFDAADTVFLATGTDFPDALGAAPAASALGSPVLLTRSDCAPSVIAGEIGRLGAERIVVLGGQGAVSDDAAALQAC